MLPKCAGLLLLMAASALADSVGLSRVGDQWSYAPSAVLEPLERTAWTQPEFDDSTWARARSGFSAGYPSGEATLLNYSVSDGAILFRRRFLLEDLASVKWLVLRMDYSHGFVAYLNGQEIARRNLEGAPGTEVPFTAGATNYHTRGEPETLDVTAAVAVLLPGTNVFAVQLHSHSNWPVLCLSSELLANFNRGPFLQNLSSNRVDIVWRTPVPSDTRVAYGTSLDLETEVWNPALVTTHVATLTGLAPDATYHYQVRSSAGGVTAVFGPASFHTFKPSGPLRFAVLGDGGWNSLAQYDIAEVIRASQPDFVVQTGDNVYPSFTDWLADPRWFSVYQPHMAGTPYFFALGNHDIYSGVGHYLEAFYLPTNSVPPAVHGAARTSPEHYYSFEHGDAHFTVLYLPFLSQYQLVGGDAQFNWLTNDLASTSKPWKIVIFHVPMNSSSAHRFDDTNLNGIPDRLDISNVLLPVLARYGVQLVFCGHEHGYERFNPIQGVHGITTAGGGVGLYGFLELDYATAFFASRHNCVRVAIEGDILRAEAVGTQGEVFDRMSICRALPASDGYRAVWNSPAFPVNQPSDSDGNFVGQLFNFGGEPVPGVTGQFSNLGQAFVNYDGANLFIGLEQVMIPSDSTVLLFLEVPRLAGVENLDNVGNGRIDPGGQGADGLDTLSNLSFTAFRPSIGCILGDEFADGQFRSFRRRNSPLDTGQGVFRLDAELASVPGVQVQQFQTSPHNLSLLGEENANFIQVAIPITELGGLQAGDVIRIGAVVSGPRGLPLDSGFVGRGLSFEEGGRAILEGIPVVLEHSPDADEDADGLSRAQELALGTDPARSDTDGDTLPDGWEAANALDPLSAEGEHGSQGDPDGDGAGNSNEWLAGTDPRRSQSAFRLGFERVGEGEVRIWWPAAAGRKYRIQASDGMGAGFIDVEGAELSASNDSTDLRQVLNLRGMGEGARFFRVRIVPPVVGP